MSKKKNKIDRPVHDQPGQDASPEGIEALPPIPDDQIAAAAFLAKRFSDANRLRILLLLTNGKQSVSAIVGELGLSQALVSHHLKELKRSLLVTVERQGPFIYYALSDYRILNVIETLNDIAGELLTARKTF